MDSDFEKAFAEAAARRKALKENDLAKEAELDQLKDIANSIIDEHVGGLGLKVVNILRELKIQPVGRAHLEGDGPGEEVYLGWWDLSVRGWAGLGDSTDGELIYLFLLEDGTLALHPPGKMIIGETKYDRSKFDLIFPLDASNIQGYAGNHGYRLSDTANIWIDLERRKLLVGTGRQVFQEENKGARMELNEYVAKYIQYKLIK